MALAKDSTQLQACTYYETSIGAGSSPQLSEFSSSVLPYGLQEAGDGSSEKTRSVINFKNGYDNVLHKTGSLLSFEHHNLEVNNNRDEYSMWEDNYNWNHIGDAKCSTEPRRLLEDLGCMQTASNFSSVTNFIAKENQHGGDGSYGWLYAKASAVADDAIQESEAQDAAGFNTRPHQGDVAPALKKQCTGATKKSKPKSSVQSKDPQSIAAKNRRERISERLKILQELVPNGSKVDLVTMLEKAISYVKFLQLQAKVLATDEFWPVQGGKAPDISQVKEAIDAILSSQRDRNSSSSSK